MKLFLDDVRQPKDCSHYMYKRIGALNPIYLDGGWLIVKNYNEFVDALKEHYTEITHVSFDHDLADEHYHYDMYNGEAYNNHYDSFKEKTGYDCAKFMKQFYEDNHMKLPVMFVHSMNPVGVENIVNVFK